MKNKKYIKEAIENIRDDRDTTRELLDDAIKLLAADKSRHREMGGTLAKYVETLQRSNEQLVKICGLLSKGSDEDEITDKDYEGIYDDLEREKDKDGK